MTTNRLPIIATLGGLVAVVCAIAVTMIVVGAPSVVGGIALGFAAVLLVLLGILSGVEIRSRREE